MGCVCAFTLVRCVALDTQSDGSCGTAVSDTNLLGQRASHAICDSRLLQLVRGCGAQDNVRDSLTASKCFMRVNSTSFRKCVRVHECERIAHSLVCSRTDVHSRVRNECGDGEAKHSILRRHRSHTTLSLSTTPLAPVLTVTKRVMFFLNFLQSRVGQLYAKLSWVLCTSHRTPVASTCLQTTFCSTWPAVSSSL
jgi:hypothetical protein